MGCKRITYKTNLELVKNEFTKELTSNKSDLKERSKHLYGFNGMEKDNSIKGQGNSYDFGARMYDPRVGRWLSVDPLAKKYPGLSPYNFVGNSPIKFVDYGGKDFGVTIDHSGNTILITANFYTVGEDAQAEATAAAKNWNALSGSKVKIGGETYTVTVKITSKMAEGSTLDERFTNAHKSSETDLYGNTYNGKINGFKDDDDYGEKEGRAITDLSQIGEGKLEAGLSDGKNITMPLYNIDGGLPYYGPNNTENSVEHEMGHNLGLDDPGGTYYSSDGAMDYSGPYKPHVGDLINVIKYALDGGTGNAEVRVTNQADQDSPEDYEKLESSDVGQ